MKATKKAIGACAATAVLLGTMIATAPTTSADSMQGCSFPRVCFYLKEADYEASRPTASYKDVTKNYQNLGPRARGSFWVVNTRNDDRVSLRYTVKGSTQFVCLDPNHKFLFGGSGVVTGVRIETPAACP